MAAPAPPQSLSSAIALELSSMHDLDRLAEQFKLRRKVHIAELLNPTAAQALYHCLDRQISWSTQLISQGEVCEAAAIAPGEQRSAESEMRLNQLAYENAQHGNVGYIYDVCPLAISDLSIPSEEAIHPNEFLKFINSDTFIRFIRQITGIATLAYADAQATRLRAGHFTTFHYSSGPDKNNSARRLNYVFYLTPEWKAEWGGLLEFRGEQGFMVESHVPCFNCFDLFRFPHGHWISMVSPIASGPSYLISGGVYID